MWDQTGGTGQDTHHSEDLAWGSRGFRLLPSTTHPVDSGVDAGVARAEQDTRLDERWVEV